ncbi:trypsin-like cysteine/serine peptidase domain-containing protein [Limtongia smithiae]|uniref:trypsin-like cysteine/serine peptidase domain-containing protein n=1 Tax=Limtongia smithiae TaxID=1125753 RepID=UPI0034CFFE5D
MVVTNLHVAPLDAACITVRTSLNSKAIRVVSSTRPVEGMDIVFLRVDEPFDMFARVEHEVEIRGGAKVMSIGYGLYSSQATGVGTLDGEPLVSRGIITQVVKLPLEDGSPAEQMMLATSAACWNGSSGGGLFAMPEGKLVGMITSNAKVESTGMIYPQLGFAIPTAVLRAGLDAVLCGGHVQTSERVKRLWTMQSTHKDVPQDTKKVKL